MNRQLSFANYYNVSGSKNTLGFLLPKSEIIYDVSLIRRELLRVKEFGRLALNEMQSLKLITEIENTYEDYDFSDETIDEL